MVLVIQEVENLVKDLLLCHGGESPEAQGHVAQQRGLNLLRGRPRVQVVVDNHAHTVVVHTIDDSLAAHGWVATKRAQN